MMRIAYAQAHYLVHAWATTSFGNYLEMPNIGVGTKSVDDMAHKNQNKCKFNEENAIETV